MLSSFLSDTAVKVLAIAYIDFEILSNYAKRNLSNIWRNKMRTEQILDAVTTANEKVSSKDIIGLEYETTRVLVGKNDLKKLFEINTDRRDIRNSQVNKLLNVLTESKNFAGVFLVNKIIRNGAVKLRMIDCNHRYESLLKFFELYPDKKVWIELHIFDNLTLEQERLEFHKSNNHINQTTSDYVQMYKDELNIWKVIDSDKNFPVKIGHKSSATRYALHTLLFPYITRDIKPYKGGFDGGAMDFIDIVKGWNKQKNLLNVEGQEVYGIMKAFLKDFVSLYGAYSPKNMFWRPPVYFPIFRIWWENKQQAPYTEVLKRLSKLDSTDGRNQVKYWSGMGAPRGNCERAVVDFLTIINSKNSKNLFFITSKTKGNPETGEDGKEFKEYGRA